MNKIIRKKNENYTIVSNVCVRDNRISLKAKGMMSLVMSLPDDWDFSIQGLSSIVKEGKSAIYTAINELKDFGYCQVVSNRDDKGKIIGNDYTFFEEPCVDIPYTEKPYTENQDMDNPNMDNQDLENQPQINKDIKEIKTETIKEKEDTIISSKKKYSLDLSIVAPEMREAVDLWLAYKKEKGQTYKPTGFKTFYNNLIKLSDNNPMLAMRIVEKSMQNNYAGIFALRDWEKETILRDLPTQQQDMPTNNDMVINGQIYR